MHPVLQRSGVEVRDRSRLFVQVWHITTYATGGNHHFFHYIISSFDIPILSTEPKQLGTILEKKKMKNHNFQNILLKFRYNEKELISS